MCTRSHLDASVEFFDFSGVWEFYSEPRKEDLEDDNIVKSGTSDTLPSLDILSMVWDQAYFHSPKATLSTGLGHFQCSAQPPFPSLKMKPIRARGFGNKFQAQKLARCVVSGQNQTQSQDIRAIWFPLYISSGRSCGFYGIWDQFRRPTGAMFTEPRKTGAGKHTCLHTPE